MTALFLLALAIASNSLAGILLKIFNNKGGKLYEINLLLFTHVGSAIALYFSAFIFYTLLLRYLPLGKSYAIMTFGVQIVLMITGAYCFGEKITSASLIGMLLIITGLALINQGIRN